MCTQYKNSGGIGTWQLKIYANAVYSLGYTRGDPSYRYCSLWRIHRPQVFTIRRLYARCDFELAAGGLLMRSNLYDKCSSQVSFVCRNVLLTWHRVSRLRFLKFLFWGRLTFANTCGFRYIFHP